MSGQVSRRLLLVGTAIVVCAFCRIVISAQVVPPGSSPAAASADDAPAPAVEQAYIGTNQCFVCHRQQANAWSETNHAQAHTHLPETYRNDAACLKCHVTGFDRPSGFVARTDKDLSMVGCESCHGPGALHVDAAQRFVLATANEAEIEQEMRESIIKTPTDSVCVACHTTQAHGSHPAYGEALPSPAAGGSVVQCEPVVPCDPVSSFANRSAQTGARARYAPGYSVKTCGSCHYDRYKHWRDEKHADLAAALPAKYSRQQDCRQCHVNAGAAVGRLAMGTGAQPNQIGVTCESCHGPALEHVRFNVRYIHGPPLGAKLEQAARQSIRKGKPAAACIQCHVVERHQEHPQFDRE